jgi:ABC-type nitrate/sulfonate/bicarbonate transport system ATPase subunit
LINNQEQILSLNQVNKNYDKLQVLNQVSFYVNEGEFVTLLGPSGSGKSTIFRIITGLTGIDSGNLEINTPLHSSGKNKIAYMPQKDTLLPWKKLKDNIALPLILKGVKKEEAWEKVKELIPVFGLEGFEEYYPNQLSGGMKQRASLMRTFLAESNLMLLDEPFASLDAITRTNLQEWLLEVWQKFNRSVLFVTHSIEEAIYLSDRIYVLSKQPGEIILELEINLPRPRKSDIMTSAEFNNYREILYKSLRGN